MPCASRHPATTYSPANHAPMRTCEQSGGKLYDNAMKNTFNAIEGEINRINYEISPINFIISPTNSIISPINSVIDGINYLSA